MSHKSSNLEPPTTNDDDDDMGVTMVGTMKWRQPSYVEREAYLLLPVSRKVHCFILGFRDSCNKLNKPSHATQSRGDNTHNFNKLLIKNRKERPEIQQNRKRIKYQFQNQWDYDKIKGYCEQTKIQYATGIAFSERPVEIIRKFR